VTAHILEAASSLDHLFLPPFERDTYPDREFSSPLRRALQRLLLTSSGLVGQDMRHLDKIWILRKFADSWNGSGEAENAPLLPKQIETFSTVELLFNISKLA